jgi:hypothetical protein
LRFWPEKRWKKAVLVTLLVLIAVGAPIVAFLEYSVYREVVSPIEVKNPTGLKTALVIYHPGLQPFAHDIAYGYADGLAQNGWRVEITTASSQAPTDLSNYSLLVLTWPIYDFNPGPTITNYVKHVGDLNGTDIVIVMIGGGLNPFNSGDAMQKTVKDANGTIRDFVTLFRGGGNYATRAQEAAATITP